MWLLRACRGCLTTEGNLQRVNDITWRMFEAITGLEIGEADGYPNMLCTECCWMLKKSNAYRRKCRRAFMVIKQIMLKKNTVLEDDIRNVDLKKNSLQSSIGFLQSNRTGCYRAIEKSTADPDPVTTMTRYFPKIEKSTIHIVDITSCSNNVALEPEYFCKDEEMKIADQLENDDSESLKDIAEEVPATIDMYNIFADLEEDKSLQEEDFEGTTDLNETTNVVKMNEQKQKYQEDKQFYKNNENYFIKLASALENCKLRLLTLEEQTDIMNSRLEDESYKNATFKCLICVTPFINFKDLDSHVTLHNSTKGKFDCKICKYKLSFFKETDLLFHNATWHTYEYLCNHCTEKLYSANDLITHLKQEHIIAKLSDFSDIFEKQLRTPEEMHKATSNRTGMECHICKLYIIKGSYEKHLESHTNMTCLDDVNCDICGVWMDKNCIRGHMRSHKYKFKCKICGSICMTKKMAYKHYQKHNVLKNKTCEVCNKIKREGGPLLRHKIQVHKIFGKFHCGICGSNHDEEYFFYKHQLIEHGYFLSPEAVSGDAELYCASCDVQFANTKAYKTHLFRIHPESADKTNACECCNEIFDNKDDLTKHNEKCSRKCPYCPAEMRVGLYFHIQNKHPGLSLTNNKGKSPPAICEVCGKIVATTAYYHHVKRHFKVMNTQLDKRCPCCSFADKRNKNPNFLFSHIIKRHLEKPWQCKLCLKKWRLKENCKNHIMRKHGGYNLTDFKCEICLKTYRNNAHLRRHYKNIHSVAFKFEGVKKCQIKPDHKIALYPHMQLNITGLTLPDALLDKIEVQIWDYFSNLIDDAPDKNEYIKILQTEPKQGFDHNTDINPNIEEMERRESLKINIFDTKFDPHAIIDYSTKPKDAKNHRKRNPKSVSPTHLDSKLDIKDETMELGLPEPESSNTLVIDDDSRIIHGEDGVQYIMINGDLYTVEDPKEHQFTNSSSD